MSRESRTHFQPDSKDDVSGDLGAGVRPASGTAAGQAGNPGADTAPAEGNGGGYGAASAQEEIETLRRALAEAQDSASGQRDLYMRAAAELDNVRKRAQRDVEQAHRYAVEGFAAELLPVRDSLELAVRSGANADAQTLLAGQQGTLKLLQRAFEKFSIRPIDPVGQRFDPNQHEAVLMQEAGAAAPNSVLEVVQPGYELNGRLLRPARVIVARPRDGSEPEGGR